MTQLGGLAQGLWKTSCWRGLQFHKGLTGAGESIFKVVTHIAGDRRPQPSAHPPAFPQHL